MTNYGLEPLVIAKADVRSSTEAADGSAVTVTASWPVDRAHEVWITSRFVMPSGRIYRVDELRWRSEGDGYVVTIHGRRAP